MIIILVNPITQVSLQAQGLSCFRCVCKKSATETRQQVKWCMTVIVNMFMIFTHNIAHLWVQTTFKSLCFHSAASNHLCNWCAHHSTFIDRCFSILKCFLIDPRWDLVTMKVNVFPSQQITLLNETRIIWIQIYMDANVFSCSISKSNCL